MKPAVLYRICSVVFVLFAMGHTFGFLSFKPPTPEGMAVRQAMANVHFQVSGNDFSYGRFYEGFGLSITTYMLFSAFLCWRLAKRPDHAIGWAFCAMQVVSLVLSWIYFAAAPAAFSGVLALGLGVAAWKTQTTTLS